jgi:hypothetical protein
MSDFVMLDDLRQSHLESFDDAYWELKDSAKHGGKGKNRDNGFVVRAALAAGWFGPDYVLDVEKRVSNMKPSAVIELADMINAKYKVVTAVNPTLLWQWVSTYLTANQLPENSSADGVSSNGEALPVAVG